MARADARAAAGQTDREEATSPRRTRDGHRVNADLRHAALAAALRNRASAAPAPIRLRSPRAAFRRPRSRSRTDRRRCRTSSGRRPPSLHWRQWPRRPRALPAASTWHPACDASGCSLATMPCVETTTERLGSVDWGLGHSERIIAAAVSEQQVTGERADDGHGKPPGEQAVEERPGVFGGRAPGKARRWSRAERRRRDAMPTFIEEAMRNRRRRQGVRSGRGWSGEMRAGQRQRCCYRPR